MNTTGRDATTSTSSTADAATSSAAPDAAVIGQMDAATTGNRDATLGDVPIVMGMDARTSTTGLGPACTAAELCCMELPVGMQMCLDLAAAGDEAACQMRLDQARGFGFCADPTADAGPPMDANTGPLTPECAALEPCCAQAGALMSICTRLVTNNDPMRCQQTLDLLAGRGIMCTPAADAGTSLDAGTSSVADGG